MDSNFNPIKDLQPTDPFNLPAGESTKSIEAIRLRLVETRNRTAGIVDILKKKNKDFSKDIKTIRELNRRLMRTIPRIPILRGDASIQGGSLEEISARRGQFDLDFRTTTVPTDLVKPTANIRGRLINFAVDILLFFYGGRLIKALFPGLKDPKLIKKLNDLLKLDDLVDDSIRVNPIRKKPSPNPIKIKEPIKVEKVFGNKRTVNLTNDIKGKVNTIRDAFARGDKNTAKILADEAFKTLNDKKIRLLEQYGGITKPTKIETANFNKLLKEIDDALARVNDLRIRISPPSKSVKPEGFKDINEIMADFEKGNFSQSFFQESLFDTSKFFKKNVQEMKGSMFKNLQLDDEINRALFGDKYIQRVIKKTNFNSIKTDTSFSQNNFFIVDDTFQGF